MNLLNFKKNIQYRPELNSNIFYIDYIQFVHHKRVIMKIIFRPILDAVKFNDNKSFTYNILNILFII